MPIYDYECRNCGHRVEVIHGVNASGPSACERCGGPMRKMLTTPSIVFKGSGWAKKDRSSVRAGSKSDESSTPAASGESTPKSGSTEGSTGGQETSSTDKSDSKAPAKETKSSGGTGPTD